MKNNQSKLNTVDSIDENQYISIFSKKGKEVKIKLANLLTFLSGQYLPLEGGTMTGDITLNDTNITSADGLSFLNILNSAFNLQVTGAIDSSSVGLTDNSVSMTSDNIQFNEANTGDGVFTISMETITFANTQTAATNAAALASGLTAGMIYKTATGELRIVV